MKFTRRNTKPGKSPYEGAEFLLVPVSDDVKVQAARSQHRREPNHTQHTLVEFPIHWSACARKIVLRHCLVHQGIACDLIPIAEGDVPDWLWRHEADETGDEFRGETSLCAVVDRICGGWTYQGWKGGYFDSEADARIYYDECRWLLLNQKISPSIDQWQHAGRHWAYGHDVSTPSTFLTDFRTGAVRRADQADLPPHGLVINATGEALAGDGGVWDLWRREGEILSQGGQCGVNISNLRSAPASRAAAGVAEILDIGDTMARSAGQDETKQPPKRRVTMDAKHPDSDAVARRPVAKMAVTEADSIGTALARRHVQAIIDACTHTRPHKSGKKGPSASLRLALQSARQALLPEQLINRTVELARMGLAQTADDLLGSDQLDFATGFIPSSSDAITVTKLDDASMEQAGCEGSRLDRLVQSVMIIAWSGIESGLHFETTAEAWNTCRHSGSIGSASGDGSFMFLDDTASHPWLVNAMAFLETDKVFDVAGYQHAVELVTIAADISLMTSTAVTPRLARRIWDFRPLSLSLTGLGQCLMAAGAAYDSGAGRALAASLNALLTGTAYRVSAQLAAALGRFPEYSKNAGHMLRVLDGHSDMVANCAHESLPPGLVEAVEETWSEALRIGTLEGFRNAQLSVLYDAGELATLLNSETSGLSPIARLIIHRQSAAGPYEKKINPAVRHGLRALGYTATQIDAIVRHVAGHATLANAPGVNHETLRKRGFTNSAIDALETALSRADDISMAFIPVVLGEEYCRHMLGFTSAELNDDDFDMLAALGFSDAGIEAANIYCCGAGTLEGAPHLAPEHLAVFDCAEPQGARGARCVTSTAIVKMMGSVQPHISGAIGQVLPMAPGESLDDYRAALTLAWRLKVKSITLQQREPNQITIPPVSENTAAADQALPVLRVIDGSQSPALSAVNNSEQAESGVPSDAPSRTNVADGSEDTASDSKASRRAFSHAARSAASVSSSADAVVEQRHV